MRGGDASFHVLLSLSFYILRMGEGPLGEGLKDWEATCHPFALEAHICFGLEVSILVAFHVKVMRGAETQARFCPLGPSSSHGTSGVPGIPRSLWPGNLADSEEKASGPQHS